MATIPEADKLAQILKKIQNDLANIKAGSSTSQLENSAIEVTQSRGYIPIMENGQVKYRIGRQPDGTITGVSMNNLTPPLIPNNPVCVPFIGGVTVSCDGFGGQQYADFSHINVYVDDNLYGTLMKVPEAIAVAPLSPTPHKFQLKSVNLSNTESGYTDAVMSTPNLVVTADMANGIITDLQLANDAVTAAKIAAGAITSVAIGEQEIETVNIDYDAITTALIASGAITSAQIAANAVTALQINAGAVTAGAIAAGAVTADKLAANSVTAAVIQAGTITATQLAANSVTTVQLAANSVVSASIVAGAIQASNIATGTITADKLVAGTITSDKLAANSVTALQIAANAITSGAITAGSVTADKLESQLVLASQIVAGSLTGPHVVLDSTGMTQIDSHGNIQVQVGVTGPNGNSYTVIDPTDPSNALASIGGDGSMSMSGIAINGSATINGIDLIYFLNSLPRGIMAQGFYTGNTPATTGVLGLFELSCDVIAGRAYQILSDVMTPVAVTDTQIVCGGLTVYYTLDGSVPRSTSGGTTFGATSAFGPAYSYNNLVASGTSSSDAHFHYTVENALNATVQFNDILQITSSGRLRVLFCIYAANGYNVYLKPVNSSANKTNMYIIDQGPLTTNTGGTNSGTGTTNATGQYVTTLPTTYCKYAGDATGTTTLATGLHQGKLGTTNYMSMLGFNYASIVTLLTGATIVKVELYLYSNYWAVSTGGIACIGLHNATGTPTTYSFTTRDVLDQSMKKPQGMWITLPNSVGTALQAGTAKGLVLDSRITNPTTSNYGEFRDSTYTDSTVYPSLRITYTK